MDQLKTFLTRRNIIALIILAVLAVGLLVGLRLVQQQTQLKSKAAGSCNAGSTFCMWFDPDPATTGQQLQVFVVGQEGDTNIRIDGSFSSSAIAIFDGGACGQSSYKHCWRFSIPASQVTAGSKTVRFLSDQAPAGRVGGTVTVAAAQASPSPSPASQPVTISGRVTRLDGAGISGVEVKIIKGTTNTTTTNSQGNFSLSNFIKSGELYAVRSPDITGYTRAPLSHYENQVAGRGDCAQSCDFTYTPIPANSSKCSYNFKSLTTGTNPPFLESGKKYNLNIIMENTGNTVWKELDRYQLKASKDPLTGEDTMILWNIASPLPGLGNEINPGSSKTFPLQVSAPTTKAGEHRQVGFYFIMAKGEQIFGLACEPSEIDITPPSAGGPDTPVPFDFSVDTGGGKTVTQGSTISQTVVVTRLDSNPATPQVILSVSGFPSGVSGSFSSISCTPSVNSSCTKTLTITAEPNASTITSTVTVIGEFGQLEKRADFELTVRPATTAFNFTLSTPSDITLTKSQADSGRNVTISKTAGEAEDVSLSSSGAIGGAIASFQPSSSCKPDNNNQCQRILTFDTSSATAGEYVMEIQGRATGGRAQVSNPFRLKINPSAGVVTCFVISENRNTRDLFRNCAQSTIDNVQSGVAGFIDTSLLVDFLLSTGNANKTLYTRFLKLPAGESITTCTADKCKDTTAGITLNVAGPSPSPVTGCACQTDNSCSTPCQFTRLTGIDYGLPPGSGPIQCFLPAAVHNIIPTSQDKDGWCNRQSRTLGDADGNGIKDENDYLYWLTAVNLGKVPVSVNPDFDGDGQIDADDLTIWQR